VLTSDVGAVKFNRSLVYPSSGPPTWTRELKVTAWRTSEAHSGASERE
jgi:hypothetical protein